MTRKEFITLGISRGYCNKFQGSDFCSRHPQQDYSEADLERLYEFSSNQDWAGTSDPFGQFRRYHKADEDDES